MQSSLETPLPTAHRLSETYKLPSGIGKDVPPEDFSPLPRATYSRRKMGENRAPTDQAINRRSSLRGINSKHSKKSDNEERLARTSSGNLKENASGDISTSSNKKGKSSSLSSIYSQRAPKEAKSRSGTRRSYRQAKHSASSRSSSPGSRVQPLSSPFTSRPSSAASSPKSVTEHTSPNAVTMNIVRGNVRPVKSKSGQFKVPFLPNTRSNQYGVHSTATSPAHSTICAHSPIHDIQDHVNNVVKARRPSAPSATRPSSEHIFSAFPYAAQEPEDDSITLANRGILGLTFDRPPSQLDYTHVYCDSEGQYLGGCDLDGVDEDLFSESLSTLLIPYQPSNLAGQNRTLRHPNFLCFGAKSEVSRRPSTDRSRQTIERIAIFRFTMTMTSKQKEFCRQSSPSHRLQVPEHQNYSKFNLRFTPLRGHIFALASRTRL